MTDAPAKSLGRRGQVAVVAGLAVLVAVAVAVRYGVGPGDATPAQCRPALARAASIAALAKGEVAIFQPAHASQDLSGLAFTDDAGRPVTLAALSGRTLLVNFWATWCVPCRAEMPALDRLQAARGGADFAVVAVNLDVNSTTEREKAFLADVGATHLAFYADPKLALTAELKRRGLVFGLPTTLLLDGRGCRIGSAEGGAAWDSPDATALIAAAASPSSGI